MRTYIPDNYGISRNRYKELSALCLQYEELKRKKADCLLRTSSAIGAGVKTNGNSSPVERIAEEMLKYSQVLELIENTAKEVCGEEQGLFPFLLSSVTQGLSYYKLGAIPCGKDCFYRLRRRFFYELSQKR